MDKTTTTKARPSTLPRPTQEHCSFCGRMIWQVFHRGGWVKVCANCLPHGTPFIPDPPRKNPHAVALGRKGGQVGGLASTPAKRRAARANGKQGGRPKSS